MSVSLCVLFSLFVFFFSSFLFVSNSLTIFIWFLSLVFFSLIFTCISLYLCISLLIFLLFSSFGSLSPFLRFLPAPLYLFLFRHLYHELAFYVLSNRNVSHDIRSSMYSIYLSVSLPLYSALCSILIRFPISPFIYNFFSHIPFTLPSLQTNLSITLFTKFSLCYFAYTLSQSLFIPFLTFTSSTFTHFSAFFQPAHFAYFLLR